jgi:hypothetical protein
MDKAPAYQVKGHFLIDPFVLVDIREVDRALARRAWGVANQYLEKQHEEEGEGLCDYLVVKEQFQAAWKERLVNGATTDDWSEFDRTFEPKLTDSDYDSRLGNIMFLVTRVMQERDGTRIDRGTPDIERYQGAFYLYNIRETSRVRGRIHATAYIAAGLPYKSEAETTQWFKTMRALMKGFLKVDLPLVDGGHLRIDDFEFPTNNPDQHWSGHWSKFYIGNLFDEAEGEGHLRENDKGTIKRLHRRVQEKFPDTREPELEESEVLQVSAIGDVTRRGGRGDS